MHTGKPHDGQYLCYAWGESDRPVCAIVKTRDQVVNFVCNQWFGERPETMHPTNLATFNDFMAEFDAPEWDMDDEIVAEFEIGGLSVTKVFEVGA